MTQFLFQFRTAALVSLLSFFEIFFLSNAFAYNESIIPTISPSDVAYYLNNPKYATNKKFDTKDDQGNRIESPSIIQMSGQLYSYAVVYHTPYPVTGGNRYKVNLAVSNDLMNWKFIRTLIDNADMPKIFQVNGAAWVMITHEQWKGSGQASVAPCQLGFELYYDFNDLINGTVRSSYFMSQYVSALNGTPSVYEAHLASHNGYWGVDGQFGFHYWNGTRDTNAVTTITNLFNPSAGTTTSSPSTLSNYDNLMISSGVSGNLGQRDTLVTSNGRYNVQEGNIGVPGASWSDWRIWLYTFGDSAVYPTGNGTVTQLSPQTPNGSFSFGNPSISVVNSPSGVGQSIVVSYFIFGEGAGAGEAYTLLYYYDLSAPIKRFPSWLPAVLQLLFEDD